MALINSLKSTRLKNLRYTGLGPAVQKDINNPPVYNSFSRETEARGDDAQRLSRAIVFGSPNFASNLAALNAIDQGRRRKPVQRPPDDVPRGGGSNNIGRFLTELGRGIRDIANLALDVIEQTASSAVQTPTIIAATLAQAAAESGTHFVYGFGVKGKYIPGIANPHVLAKFEGRVPISGDFDRDRSELKEAWSSLTPKPGARHPLPDGNLLLDNRLENPPKVSAFDFVKSKSNDTIGDAVIKDFTKKGDNGNGEAPQIVAREIKKETRLGLSTNRRLTRYTDKYIDKKSEFSDDLNLLEPTTNEFFIKDHIKFKFSIINPDEDTNMNLYFRAFLSSFTDNYQGAWNNTKYLGRAEDFYTYQGFTRSINMGFKVAAFTRNELRPIYNKLVVLASTTAPTYSTDNGFMRGTLVTSTVGDYLVNQPGFISSVDYSWQTSYPWEVKLGGNEETDVQQLPHILDVSLAFTPIHRFSVQTGKQHYITNPGEVSFVDGTTLTEQFFPPPPKPDADFTQFTADRSAFDLSIPTVQAGNQTSGFNSVLNNNFTFNG